MNESLDWYRVFYHTAVYGNITAAAEKLYISQPAVSQCIKQLESSLGCRLFVRTPKGVTLTAEGKTLFLFISKGMEQIELGEKRLSEQLSLESGEIYIGASDMTLEFYLLPYLEEFHRQYPKIRINITNGPTPETLEKLENNMIDFGAVTEPLPETSGFISAPVRQIEDIFICGSEYIALEERSATLEERSATLEERSAALEERSATLAERTVAFEEFLNLPLIMLEPNTSTRKYVDSFLGENGVSVTPEFELATSRLIVQFVKRNLGVGCVVKDFAEEALREKSVFTLKLEKEIPKRNICIIRKNTTVSKASEKLLDLLLK